MRIPGVSHAFCKCASSWRLGWKAQDGRWLNYTLRTEAGKGLLALRNFTLPTTIFSVNAPAGELAAGDGSEKEMY